MSTGWERGHERERAAARQRLKERLEAGLPVYTVDPDPTKRFAFFPQVPPDRRAVVRALARAATLCRDLRGARRGLLRSIMAAALDRAEAKLVNRLLAKKAAWAQAGCPPAPLPWALVGGQVQPEKVIRAGRPRRRRKR